MIPTKFPGVTNYLGAPPGWNPDGELGECMPLPVMHDEHGFTSLWIPDSDELAALNAGAGVQLTIMANAHPVVSVQVSNVPTTARGGSELRGDHLKDGVADPAAEAEE